MLPGRAVRFATVMAVALLAGLLSGPASTAISGVGNGELTLRYACGFASGTQEVVVALTQTYPRSAAVGRPIQPGALTAEVTIPRAGVTALLPAPAATLSGTAGLAVHVTQGTSAADASWPGLTAPATPAGGTDDLRLAFTGPVPPLSVTAPGQVKFEAGDLTLTLHPVAAATTSPTPTPAPKGGTPDTATLTTPESAAATANPAAPLADISGTCSPKAGQTALLATVRATGAPAAPPAKGAPGSPPGSAPRHGASRPTPGGGTATARSAPSAGAPATGKQNGTITLSTPVLSDKDDCPPAPTADPDPQVIAEQAKQRPPGATLYPAPGDPPIERISQCGFITGLSNVAKLKGASVLNDLNAREPSMANIATVGSVFSFADEDNPYVEIDSVATFDIPPARTTFLTYGFMPTTATMHLTTRRGVMTVITTGIGAQLYVTAIYGKDDLRLSDVKINGTPMDVGPHCQTAAPLDIALLGLNRSGLDGVEAPSDYSIQTGGPLFQDDLFIPRFTGCRSASGENLDAMFTSAISGHGNSLNLIQGPLCAPLADPTWCSPKIPYPVPPHR
ncbi:DUF6801 domain-containing protein [Streptomyces sp. NBC_01198]|uniref:DUF6801 domain-containing protein n=1 Tax=Streptomyces sp. NBC_01198 TaxID=2903769 RepID=UPI002E15CF77|nr:hypothetical protein OG702_26435 [Streptomyces sp. NBC_01198]